MKTTDNDELIFTDEQLKNMSSEHLMELLAIQKKHSESLEIKIKLYEEKLQHLEFINALLSEKLTLSQRRSFGASSEKYADGYEQGSLFNEAEENADSGAPEPQYEEVHPSSYKRKKKKGKKENDLSSFPVVRIEHKLTEEELLCQECNKILKVMTTETTRYLRLIPARFETVEEVVYVYGCPECGAVKRAEKEPSLFKSSIATPSLVAGIMNAKYVNSVPLNRQEQEFKRYDLDLSTRTMSNWMIRCAQDYLYLVYDRIKSVLLQGKYTHCDETRIQVLGEPEQKAEIKNWMWVYMTDELSGSPPMSIYQYERRLKGFVESYLKQKEQPAILELSFEERFSLIVDHEWMLRQNRLVERLVKKANLRISACLEDIDYNPKRQLDKNLIARLSTCDWINQGHNLLVTGKTGSGKTYMACAFGNAACRKGYSVKYYRTSRLLTDLNIAQGDGTYQRLLVNLKKVQLLILDDWGLSPFSQSDSRELLEVIEDRSTSKSTIIASQLPLEHWHSALSDPTIADAILDRIVHDSYTLEIDADDSMRKIRSKKNPTDKES